MLHYSPLLYRRDLLGAGGGGGKGAKFVSLVSYDHTVYRILELIVIRLNLVPQEDVCLLCQLFNLSNLGSMLFLASVLIQ